MGKFARGRGLAPGKSGSSVSAQPGSIGHHSDAELIAARPDGHVVKFLARIKLGM